MIQSPFLNIQNGKMNIIMYLPSDVRTKIFVQRFNLIFGSHFESFNDQKFEKYAIEM